MASTADALARLSPREREVLALLAQGHTAKSIAATLGVTIGAVNERLREARRKTGAASSRDLARRFAQENRDEEIGVAGAAATRRTGSEGAPLSARRSRTGLAIMIAIASALTAAATFMLSQATAPSSGGPSGTAAELQRQFAAEPVDHVWATSAAQSLQALYAMQAGVGPVSATCAATLCVVRGTFSDPRRGVGRVQSTTFVAAARARGFGYQRLFETRVPSTLRTAPFTAYWARQEGDALAPRIRATSPADGATIGPGAFALSVTFDRPMRRDGYSFVTTDRAPFPDCAPGVAVSADARTFTMRCTARAGARYSVGFNHGRYRNFVDPAGRPAEGAVIGFATR